MNVTNEPQTQKPFPYWTGYAISWPSHWSEAQRQQYRVEFSNRVQQLRPGLRIAFEGALQAISILRTSHMWTAADALQEFYLG